MTEGLRLFLVVQALGFEDVSLGLSGAVFVALIGSLLTAVPLSPAGLGIVEAGVVGVLHVAYGVPLPEATAIALLDRVISVFSISCSARSPTSCRPNPTDSAGSTSPPTPRREPRRPRDPGDRPPMGGVLSSYPLGIRRPHPTAGHPTVRPAPAVYRRLFGRYQRVIQAAGRPPHHRGIEAPDEWPDRTRHARRSAQAA